MALNYLLSSHPWGRHDTQVVIRWEETGKTGRRVARGMRKVACVASVEERPRKEIFGFDRARNETRAKKWKRREGQEKEGNGLKRQMYKACIDLSGLLRFHAVYAFQNTKQKYFGFTHASSKVHFRSTEGQTFYWSIMTADDSIKCRCANLGITGQVAVFKILGFVCKSRGGGENSLERA